MTMRRGASDLTPEVKAENQDLMKNRQEFKQARAMVYNAFPDYYQTIPDWVIGNGKAVIRWTMQGMQQSETNSIHLPLSGSMAQGLMSSALFMLSRKKRKSKQTNIRLSWPLSKSIAYLLYSQLTPNNSQGLFVLQRAGKRHSMNVYLLGASSAVLIVAVIVIAIVVFKLRRTRRRNVLKQIRERYQSGQALIRYIMLNRQCSEEAAYQRVAAFNKKHVPLNEHSTIDRMLAHDRQTLLDSARSKLVHDPDEIDKI